MDFPVIHILWDIKDGPWGGGNQFLRMLRCVLREHSLYSDYVDGADIILVNSKDRLEEAAQLEKPVIHRIDGTFAIYRGAHEKPLDEAVYDFSHKHASGVVFQSEWSRHTSFSNGMLENKMETVIHNCADSEYFYPQEHIGNRHSDKVRLITSSWSSNIKKGFRLYDFLDKNLDFLKYDYVFMGRTSVPFKNIKDVGIMDSVSVGEYLRKSDIFISGSEDDACSNSIIESLTCGVPVVALCSGGTPEIVKNGGELFFSREDMLNGIDKVANNLDNYRNKITVNSPCHVMEKYCAFARRILDEI